MVRRYEYDYLHKAAAALPFTCAAVPWYYEMNFVMHAKHIWLVVSRALKHVYVSEKAQTTYMYVVHK